MKQVLSMLEKVSDKPYFGKNCFKIKNAPFLKDQDLGPGKYLVANSFVVEIATQTILLVKIH